MQKEQFDVVIIGAGPSGALAGTLLSNKGYSVVIVEKESFPRFSIGESLLPQSMVFLEQAGLQQALNDNAQSLGFQFKNGAAFHKKGEDVAFDFTQKFSDGPGTTYQVKRADFDNLLAQGAQAAGVDIRYNTTVENVDIDSEKPCVYTKNKQNETHQLEGKFLLDASGFGRVLPRLLDLEYPSDFPVRQSIFTHIEDNISHPDFDRNKILITVHPDHDDVWYWLIPFCDGRSSIGVVAKQDFFTGFQGSHEDVLNELIEQAPNLRSLLNNREISAPVRSIQGYSANVTSLHGNNYALLGNAGEFLDPVFSSGVTIAMCSATLVVPLVEKVILGEPVDLEQDYAKPLKDGVDCFRTFVSRWYDGGFQDVIFYKDQDKKIREMISSILAGYVWDKSNPFVAQSERRFGALIDLCQQ